MISPKILRNLEIGKKYLVYDCLYEYYLIRHNTGWSIYHSRNTNEYFFIIEKDYQDLISENRETEHYYFYKNEYQYIGYTNSFKAISTLGYLSLHGYFSFFDLFFYGKFHGEEDFEKLRNYKKVMEHSSRRTIARLRDKRKQ